MSDKPQLQLGDPPPGLLRQGRSPRGLWLLGTLQLVTLALVVWLLIDRGSAPIGRTNSPARSEEIRETAMALEDRGLTAEAAAAWRKSLQQSPGDDQAEILYRIGDLLMDAEDYGGAVSALVEAEQLAKTDDQLQKKIAPKIVECLRRLGRYGEVGRELSRQIEVGGEETVQGSVLATFAGETLTDADLDRMIERTVDRLLSMQPEGAFVLNREELLKQYESGEARRRMLREIVQQELFTRRARELGLDREQSFQRLREFVEAELLAGRFLARELSRIQPTNVDLEAFYQANRSDYRQPETASVVVLPLSEDQSPEEVLSQIESPDDFRNLVKEAIGPSDVGFERIVRGQTHSRLGEPDALFDLNEGHWTKEPIAFGDKRLLALVESKTPQRTPTLAEVRSIVEDDYRRRKRQELTERLFADLTARYDVEIMAEADNDEGPMPND